MTLLDAPAYDAARERRRQLAARWTTVAVALLVVLWWLAASRPVDWPWHWNQHLVGRWKANHFLAAVEKNDMATAYGIWLNDKNWQQHPSAGGAYNFTRFEADWSPSSHDNEYGAIRSHRIAAARVVGNVLLMAVLVNDLKSKPISLDYDPKSGALNFSPPDVELYLGP